MFLPTSVLEECSDPPGASLQLRRGGGIADPELWATLSKIKRAVERPDNLQPSYHAQLLRLLAAELASRNGSAASPGSLSRGGLSGRHARPVEEHLGEHFARAVPLAELAALVRLNRSHLCEAFRQTTGLTPHQFQTARRIDHAKQLLAQGGLPLAEVALAVGYSDQSQFGAAFRKATGESPGRYRLQAQPARTLVGNGLPGQRKERRPVPASTKGGWLQTG